MLFLRNYDIPFFFFNLNSVLHTSRELLVLVLSFDSLYWLWSLSREISAVRSRLLFGFACLFFV